MWKRDIKLAWWITSRKYIKRDIKLAWWMEPTVRLYLHFPSPGVQRKRPMERPTREPPFFVFSIFLLVIVFIFEFFEYFSILYFSTFHFAKWSANAQWDGGATKGLCWENVSRNPQRCLSRLSPSNMLEEKCENPIGRNGSGGLWKIKKCVNIDRCWDFVFGKNELFVKKK